MTLEKLKKEVNLALRFLENQYFITDKETGEIYALKWVMAQLKRIETE